MELTQQSPTGPNTLAVGAFYFGVRITERQRRS